MGGERLLDSNILIDLFRGDEKTRERLGRYSKLVVPIIVLGELHYGANRSNNLNRELDKIKELEDKVLFLDCDKETAKTYGYIKYELRKKGTLIPENDIWIASVGKQYGIIIVTRDAHFDKLKGIVEYEKW